MVRTWIRCSLARVLATAVVLGALAVPVHAGDDLRIKEWLSRPGVRLVAVDFYATWCKPCMAAVPAWKELHERYQNQGLRLLVVNTLDPEGRCVSPGWNPNDMICDEEGFVARQLGVQTNKPGSYPLPAAFLWSWQGNLLVQGGHVGEVEAAIEKYLRSMPRVAIQAVEAPDPGALEAMVRDKITETGKIAVVAGDAEQTLLDDIRKRSNELRYDDRMRCEPGRELPANALLKASVAGKSAKRLALTLHSAKTGCALASVTVPWNPEKPSISVAGAASKLLSRLQLPKIQMPGARQVVAQDELKQGTLFLKSDQAGTAWRIDGTNLDGTLGAGERKVVRVPFREAPYRVVLSRKGFYPYEARLVVTRDTPVATLDHVMARQVDRGEVSGTGLLVIKSNPENARVTIDGVVHEKPTPSTYEISAGNHSIRIQRKAYRDWTGEVEVKASDITEIEKTLVADFAEVKITTSPAEAEIRINGKRMGTGSYSKKQQPAGGYRLVVSAQLYHPVEETLFVEPGAPVLRHIELRPAFGRIAIDVHTEMDDGGDSPARLFLDGAPTQVELTEHRTSSGRRFTATLERIPSGEHEVEIQLARFNTLTRKLRVDDGETSVVDDVFSARFGVAIFKSDPPGATVEVDGREVGTTPIERNLDVGNHAVKFTTDTGYHRADVRQIFVAVQSRQEVSATLEVITGGLVIGTQPTGAKIFLDGKSQGTSPVKIPKVPIGVRRLEARMKGFTPKVMDVVVREGDSRVTNIELLTLGTIEVTCKAPPEDVAGVTIRHNEQPPVRASTLRLERLPTDEHTITCRSPRGHFITERIAVTPGSLRQVTLDLTDPDVLIAAWEAKRSKYNWSTLGLVAVGVAGGVFGKGKLDEANTHDDELKDATSKFLAASDEQVLAAAKADVLAAQTARNDAATMAYVGLGVGAAGLVSALITYLLAPQRPTVGEYADGATGAGSKLTLLPMTDATAGVQFGMRF